MDIMAWKRDPADMLREFEEFVNQLFDAHPDLWCFSFFNDEYYNDEYTVRLHPCEHTFTVNNIEVHVSHNEDGIILAMGCYAEGIGHEESVQPTFQPMIVIMAVYQFLKSFPTAQYCRMLGDSFEACITRHGMQLLELPKESYE